ncbi:MAG: cell division protein ZapA [Deltaproteobacteria bacterium]|nr:cell division protein ZapA [Deltaproteobacteria bacterium]
MAQRIGIELFGRTFVFETPAQEAEATKAKNLVEGEVAKILSRMGGDRAGKEILVVLMAALSLAGDYLELLGSHEALREEMKIRLEKLVEKSETLFEGDGLSSKSEL